MGVISKIYHLIVDTKIPTLAGSLCFFILLNGGSYLFLFVSLSSYFYIDVLNFMNNHLEQGIIKDIILYLLEHNSNLSISLFLLLSSVYSSSSLYYHFLHICELITKQPVENKINKRIQAILLVPIVLIIFFIIILLLSIIQMIVGNIIYLLILFFTFLFIAFLNKLALRKYPFRRLMKGIFFSFGYNLIFSILFYLYLTLFSNFKIVYGILSFIIILLFYLYSITIGLLLGIYMNCKNLEVSKLLFHS